MIRALIVDDEELARRGIRARLLREGDVEIVGECTSGREAIDAIRALRPSLVLLDVQMPGVGGFDVVAAIGEEAMPVTVFVTAHDEFALRAFDAQALDYLLKPIDDERFVRMLARVRRRIADGTQRAIGEQVSELLGRALEPPSGAPASATATPVASHSTHDPHVLVRDRGRVLLLGLDEIDWVAADGDHVRIHTAGRSYPVRETMAAMERSLGGHGFARVHRSTIVNVTRIAELRPLTGREYLVVLHGGATLRLSRRYRERLRGLVGGAL